MCGTKPSPTVTRGRPPWFIPSFRMSLRLPNLTTQGGTPLSLGSYARCQGLMVSLSTFLRLRCVTFIATPMFLGIWGTGPFRVITRLYVLSFKNRLIGDNRANAFQVGRPNIPFSGLFSSGFTTATDTLPTRLARLQISKLSLKRPKGRLFASSHARRLQPANKAVDRLHCITSL